MENIQTQVDSYRFVDRTVRKMARSWIRLETQREIPWTPLSKPLEECTVALITSTGLALKTDQPFDQQGERENPWWGDPSFRVLPSTTTEEDVRLYHLHIHPCLAEQDLNTFFPLQRLSELESRGEIGRSAASHYSYMGFIMQPQMLLEEYVPVMIDQMKREAVDAVVLVPG